MIHYGFIHFIVQFTLSFLNNKFCNNDYIRRRVYLNLLENKELFGEFKLLNSKQTIVRTWIKEQYQDYLEGLKMIIMKCEDILQEPAIKTVLAVSICLIKI